MHLLYLDESGNEDDPSDRHFVLAGAAVFERVTFFLSNDLDDLKTRRFPGTPPIEFHASAMRKGKDFWRDVDRNIREDLLQEIAGVICKTGGPSLTLFAAVVEKSAAVYGEDAVKRAIEEVCSRFDMFLKRLYQDQNDPQRGLLIFSQGRFDQRAKVWIRGFRDAGTRWGFLRNFSDIPYFASTSETRLLQVADFVSYATYLLYERRDASLLRALIHRFDQKESATAVPCDCPACHSRRSPGTFGSWM